MRSIASSCFRSCFVLLTGQPRCHEAPNALQCLLAALVCKQPTLHRSILLRNINSWVERTIPFEVVLMHFVCLTASTRQSAEKLSTFSGNRFSGDRKSSCLFYRYMYR